MASGNFSSVFIVTWWCAPVIENNTVNSSSYALHIVFANSYSRIVIK
jgi:hypothetical protein